MSTSSVSSSNLVCPVCHGPLVDRSDDRLRCSACDSELTLVEGIWRCLSSEQSADVDAFLADYRRLRQDEGWGAPDAAYYRALPFHDTTGRHTEIWRIRAASYELLIDKVLTGQQLSIVDLGAGNCWLSWRLAAEGHTVAAVDLSDDAADGLVAATAYSQIRFARLQASFDRVPLGDGKLDLAVFNGSFHYSTDPQRTLTEALRLLRPGGRVVIMDSPFYRLARSGEQMLRERRRDWRRRYGQDFGAFPTAGFLTRGRLDRLGAPHGIRWRMLPLPLGWRWRLAPLAAVALGRREPARFPLIVGQRTPD